MKKPLLRWATWMGTEITESHYYLVVQHMPTGAGGGGKGRPSILGEKTCNLECTLISSFFMQKPFKEL